MTLRYFFGWFFLLIAAVINGAIRDGVYLESLGELHAHQVSTLTVVLLFGVIIRGMSRAWPLQSSKQAWTVGGLWLVMTLCFEFGFFHFVMGHPWSELLQAYNIFEGRLWVVILLWTFIAPYVFWRLRQ
jgi:hypothetical protein